VIRLANRVYTFFSNAGLLVTSDKKSLQVDYFSTLSNASLQWSVEGGNFNGVKLNGKLVSSAASGTADVTSLVLNGLANTVEFVMGWAIANPTANAVLTIDGFLATFDIVKSQNNNIVAGYHGSQISWTQFQHMRTFQNNVASSMLVNGVISSKQSNELIAILNISPKPADAPASSQPEPEPKPASWWDKLTGGDGGGGSGWFTTKNVAVVVVLGVAAVVVFGLIFKSGGKQ